MVRARGTVHQKEACKECTRTCLLIHGQREPDPSPMVSSFFKVMIDKSFSWVMYFPPKFARLVSHLANEETYLEDSSGQRWTVRLCNRSGPLAIRQGWHKFSSEHGLKMGDFLVFHYIQGQHFVVQIFGRSGCQKTSFYPDSRKKKKRVRTDCEATSQDELLPETDINLRKKQNSTPSVTAVPESEQAVHQPVTSTLASNIDADSEKRQRVPQAEGTSDALQGENGPPTNVSTNTGSQRESSSVDGVPVEMEIVTSKTFLHFDDIGTSQTENISEPVNNVSLLDQKDDTGGKGSHCPLLSNKESHCTSSNQVTRKKSKETSQFVKEKRVEKRKLKEVAAKAHCPVKKLNGKAPKKVEKDGHGSAMAVNGNNKVIKSGPADSGDASYPEAASFSYLLRVDGRSFLELPQSWPNAMVTKKKLGGILIKLQGPDNRCWLVMYQERSGCKVLVDGWALFTAVYGLKPGDECVFQLVDLSERLFKVGIEYKLDVTQATLGD